jgi:hypothetical protein
MLKRTWIFVLLAAVLAAGCGGKSGGKSGSTTNASTTPAATGTAPATSTTSLPDCNAMGINPTGMREGTCLHGGITWTIVNQGHTLVLKTLTAKLVDVRSTKSLSSATAASTANGDYVVATVTITNKLQTAQTFDPAGTQQAGLILDGAVFKEATDAENEADANSCLKIHSTPIGASASVTCDVIFDVPRSAAADLGKHGSGDLYIVNFGSDLASSVYPQAIGQIRLYH